MSPARCSQPCSVCISPVLPPELLNGMLDISRELTHVGWWRMLFGGVSSGFLIAAMVWMIPSAESAKFAVITLMTYLIAIGGFTHMVAGSMEANLLVLNGDWEWWRMLGAVLGAGADRQHHRRHRAVRADLLRAGDGGDLSRSPSS